MELRIFVEIIIGVVLLGAAVFHYFIAEKRGKDYNKANKGIKESFKALESREKKIDDLKKTVVELQKKKEVVRFVKIEPPTDAAVHYSNIRDIVKSEHFLWEMEQSKELDILSQFACDLQGAQIQRTLTNMDQINGALKYHEMILNRFMECKKKIESIELAERKRKK